jgi:CRISPR-associated protein (TIGR03986 family)
MYFHHRGKTERTYIEKTGLNQNEHRPNGRKVYLHHYTHPEIEAHKPLILEKAQPAKESRSDGKRFSVQRTPSPPVEKKKWDRRWETKDENENRKQKMQCTPLQSGQDFYFHIDFDNLSQAELGLLLHSLYPDEMFRHRLGLGKPLGLGTVHLDIMGLFLIDRVERYSVNGLESPSYCMALRGTEQETDSVEALKNFYEALKKFYPREVEALKDVTEKVLESKYYEENGELIDENTLKLLQTVGNPDNLKEEVSYPSLESQTPEEEGFAWFAENDLPHKEGKPERQAALPVIRINQKLPTLKRWNER